MLWPEGFIAVDWGTTNRRAWRMAADGKPGECFEDGLGVLSLERETFPAAIRQIRDRLGDLPLLMAGMVGSTRGWVEAPYWPCPAGIEQLAAQLIWPEPGRTAIVPGLSLLKDGRADVMRGEEVQLFGAAAARLIPANALVCHPGTHNKWVSIAAGKIQSFRTIMTGELFNLLKEHSILSDMLESAVEPGDGFAAGVARGLDGAGVTAELFSVRASVLLGQRKREDAAGFTSGLLIGADVKAGLSGTDDREILVMGRPDLTRLYAAAIELAGRTAREVDGEQAFLAGINAIAELI
jgi:2-dehydro-3-deoxygalactonokinase